MLNDNIFFIIIILNISSCFLNRNNLLSADLFCSLIFKLCFISEDFNKIKTARLHMLT